MERGVKGGEKWSGERSEGRGEVEWRGVKGEEKEGGGKR